MTGIFSLRPWNIDWYHSGNNNIIESQQIQLIHKIEDHYVTMRTETEQLKLDLKI